MTVSIRCTNGLVLLHKEMAHLLGIPEAIDVSKEATLLALRISYGELVDHDMIEWISSL